MIRCIAIDDDPLFLKILISYFSEMTNCELIATYENPIDGIMAVVKQKPDVLLIDKEMPYLDGIESLSTLDSVPKVIMISAHLDQPRNMEKLHIDRYIRKVGLNDPKVLEKEINSVFNVSSG